jgi:hypothetical protein
LWSLIPIPKKELHCAIASPPPKAVKRNEIDNNCSCFFMSLFYMISKVLFFPRQKKAFNILLLKAN